MSAGDTKLRAEAVRVEYVDRKNRLETLALDGIDLAIRDGEFFSIVGPSGCGKTTFINAVDGLVPILDGRILVDGKVLAAPGPDRAMVFQSPSLLPWRTVLDNVTYGLEAAGVSRSEAVGRCRSLVDLVGLSGFERHYPYQLSGGMQQRVNLARALAVDPAILLMDEPFAALDAQTRDLMQAELLRIWNDAKKTVVFVTHNVGEAIFLSDRIAVFSARPGRVKEIVEIDLPRPRDISMKHDRRAIEYEEHISDLVRPEALRAMHQEQAVTATGAAAREGV